MSTAPGSREVVMAFGVPGSGKSTLLHDIVRAQSDTHVFLVSDHEDAWSNPDSAHWRGNPPKNISVLRSTEGFPLDEPPEPGLYVFKASVVDPREVAQLCLDVTYDVVFVDDEIDGSGRKGEFDDSPLRTVLNEGRHIEHFDEDTDESIIHRVHVYGACRRPQKLHNDFELATQVYCFRLQGARTLQRLRDDAYIEDEEWETIRGLPNFHFRHWPSGVYGSIKPLGGTDSSNERSGENGRHGDVPADDGGGGESEDE
jgi:hypothetical protein